MLGAGSIGCSAGSIKLKNQRGIANFTIKQLQVAESNIPKKLRQVHANNTGDRLCHIHNGDILNYAVIAHTEVILHNDHTGGVLIVCLDDICVIAVDRGGHIGNNGNAIVIQWELIAVCGTNPYC